MSNDQLPHGVRFVFEDQVRRDLSPQEVERFRHDIQNKMERSETDARVEVSQGGLFRVTFTKEADYLFYSNSWSRQNPQNHAYDFIKRFDGSEPGYQNTWLQAVEKMVGDSGLEYEVQQQPGLVKLTFPTMIGRSMFEKMADTGVFDEYGIALLPPLDEAAPVR